MPFTRPGSGNAASEDAGPGSFKAGEDAVQRLSVSLQQQRSRLSVSQDGTSFSEYSASHGSLRRPERRSSANFARGPGFVRQEGFLNVEPAGHATEASAASPRPPVAPGGLLSRQFSNESLPASRSAFKSSTEQVKVGIFSYRFHMQAALRAETCSNALYIYYTRYRSSFYSFSACRSACKSVTRSHQQSQQKLGTWTRRSCSERCKCAHIHTYIHLCIGISLQPCFDRANAFASSNLRLW